MPFETIKLSAHRKNLFGSAMIEKIKTPLVRLINSSQRIVFSSILLGLLGLYFSRFSLQFSIYDTNIHMPWCLVFPTLASMAGGKKASIITAVSGGALYPFLIWEINGWANLIACPIIFFYLYSLGYLSDFKKGHRSKNANYAQFAWRFITFLVLLWASYLIVFPLILPYNPTFWASNATPFFPHALLLTFAIKSTINFICVGLICETILRIPSVRQVLRLEVPYWMKQNTKVFLGSLLTALFIWIIIYVLDSLLFAYSTSKNYHTISFLVIMLSGGIIGRTIMRYLEANIKTKKHLKEREEQLNTIIANIPSIIYRCTMNDAFSMKMISPQIKKLTGHSSYHFIGNKVISFASLIHPEDTIRVRKSIIDQLDNGKEFEVEYRIIDKKQKTKWVSDKGIKKKDNHADLYYIDGVIEDITNRKHSQGEINKYKSHLEDLVTVRTIKLQKLNQKLNQTLAELQTMQSHLVQSEKMASLGVLTAGVAHEINNPLNHIIGGLAGLERHFDDNEANDDVKTMLKNISNGVWRATNIVKGLNQFSRSNKKNTEHCDIHSILINCINMLDFELKEKASITTKFTDTPYLIIGNVGKLHQVFINVLTNAYQAILDYGEIRIETSICDDHMLISISDTGKGILSDDIKKITDPFYTTKEPGEGTGLGLSISYTILKEHNGFISYESELGKGTTANIELPLTFFNGYEPKEEPECD